MVLKSSAHQAMCEALVKARTDAGLTQRELAARMQWQQSVLAKIELGMRHINSFELIEVADALGIDPKKLFAKIVDSTRQLPAKKPAQSRS